MYYQQYIMNDLGADILGMYKRVRQRTRVINFHQAHSRLRNCGTGENFCESPRRILFYQPRAIVGWSIVNKHITSIHHRIFSAIIRPTENTWQNVKNFFPKEPLHFCGIFNAVEVSLLASIDSSIDNISILESMMIISNLLNSYLNQLTVTAKGQFV